MKKIKDDVFEGLPYQEYKHATSFLKGRDDIRAGLHIEKAHFKIMCGDTLCNKDDIAAREQELELYELSAPKETIEGAIKLLEFRLRQAKAEGTHCSFDAHADKQVMPKELDKLQEILATHNVVVEDQKLLGDDNASD